MHLWNRRDTVRLLLGIGLGFFSRGHSALAGSRDVLPSDPPSTHDGHRSLSRPRREPASVLRVRNSQAVVWDGTSYPYVDGVDQMAVDRMFRKGLEALTGEQDLKNAWRAIVPYRPGEKIAIKPNFNDLYDEFRGYVVTPALINALLKGLIEILHVRPRNIVIFDVSRVIPDSYRRRVFYDVTYVEPYGSSFWRRVEYHLLGNPYSAPDTAAPVEMRNRITNPEGGEVQCYLPKCITMCEHLINVPLFKSHQFILASGALKNHYGTVRFSDGHLGPEYLHPPLIHECIADLNAHPLIASRTRLVVMDGLFGRANKKGGPPDLRMASLYMSREPVALDSVTSAEMSRILIERGEEPLSNRYLVLAEKAGLGVHEEASEDGVQGRIHLREVELR